MTGAHSERGIQWWRTLTCRLVPLHANLQRDASAVPSAAVMPPVMEGWKLEALESCDGSLLETTLIRVMSSAHLRMAMVWSQHSVRSYLVTGEPCGRSEAVIKLPACTSTLSLLSGRPVFWTGLQFLFSLSALCRGFIASFRVEDQTGFLPPPRTPSRRFRHRAAQAKGRLDSQVLSHLLHPI